MRRDWAAKPNDDKELLQVLTLRKMSLFECDEGVFKDLATLDFCSFSSLASYWKMARKVTFTWRLHNVLNHIYKHNSPQNQLGKSVSLYLLWTLSVGLQNLFESTISKPPSTQNNLPRSMSTPKSSKGSRIMGNLGQQRDIYIVYIPKCALRVQSALIMTNLLVFAYL